MKTCPKCKSNMIIDVIYDVVSQPDTSENKCKSCGYEFGGLDKYSKKNPKVNDILKWIDTQDGEHNDYWFNVQNIVKEGQLNQKQFGYLISTVPMYWKDIEKQKEAKLRRSS